MLAWLGRLLTQQPRALRDLALFGVGTAIVVHEAFFTQLDRPFLLTVGAACLGLPFVLGKDEAKAKAKERDSLL